MLLDSEIPPTDATVAPTTQVEESAIRVEGLSVGFRSTREQKVQGGGALRPLGRRSKRKKKRHYVAALQDVSFAVSPGSVFAVVGRNGAGKSTLCKALAGILPPSEGRVTVRGRVTPLLSLGVGFNKELTGRQNIMLGGLANGLPPETIRKRTPEILEFAELGDAIDSPMRTYSSGMGGRLAFAIVTHLDPQILLIDEALSAGDPQFKEKCKVKLDELLAGDTTVVLVTHSLGLIKAMADQVLWLDDGRTRMVGPTEDVLDAYQSEQGTSADSVLAMEDM